MIIQHNLLANFANRQLGINTNNKSKSTDKLSSGYRINKAADDSAGLSISEKMRGQIRGLDQASVNIQDGISLLQTGEGALNEVQDILQRMGEISVQAANDTYTTEDRQKINDEYNSLKKEINRITSDTEFNTYPIFLDDDLPVGGRPMDVRIYSSTPGSYGGITFESVRYEWGKIKTKDGLFSLADTNIKEGTYYLDTVDGLTLSFSMEKDSVIPNISKQYNINAGNDSIIIDNSTYYWGAVTDEDDNSINLSNPQSGMYSLNHSGSIIEFYVDSGDTLEDITRTLNNSKKLSPSWESQVVDIDLELAVSVSTNPASYPIDNINKGACKDSPYTIIADTTGIHLSGYNTVPWSDLNFSPANYNGDTQGIDFTTGTGIGYGTDITFKCPDTGITFEFRINEEASQNAVIDGLDGIIIPTSIDEPLHADLSLSNIPSIMNSFTINDTNIIIPFEKQRDDIGIDFNGTATSATDMSNYMISFSASAQYPMSAGELNDLDSFFRNGVNNSIQLTFGGGIDMININFTKDNNMTDTNRPQSGNYVLATDYQAAMDTYVNDLMDDFNSQLSSSSFSLESTGATLNTGYIFEQSMAEGNIARVPEFGIKPPEGVRIKNIQAGANTAQVVELKISKLSTAKLSIIGTDLKSHISASRAITTIHKSISKISEERSKFGAYHNRLEHAMANADNMSENLQRTESLIRDVNMADEMVNYSKYEILEQAAQSMLSQANQNPQNVLSLLQ